MRKFLLYILFALPLSNAFGQSDLERENPMYGQDTIKARDMRKWYHQGNLVYYLEAFNDHMVYQGADRGQWSESDQLIFSVDGNSFRQNKYYIDGFRINNRFQTGSTLYRPNLERYDMTIGAHDSDIRFERDSTVGNYVEVTGNFGGIGGIDKSSEAVVHVFHGTGAEGVFKQNSITNRMHVVGAGTLDAGFSIPTRSGRKYYQHIYATYGKKSYPNYDQNGLVDEAPLVNGNYYTLQLNGELPAWKGIDKLGYFVNISDKQDMGSEFYLNTDERASLRTYSASLYAKRGSLTTGLTWATNVVRHSNLWFEKNIVDQDGESMEPWYPDGNTHELSWAIDWKKHLLPWLKLKVDCYNSMIHFSPTTDSFSNEVYLQRQSQDPSVILDRQSLYRYEWESAAFTGGLLENVVGLEANHALSKVVSLRGEVGVTLDGMLLRDGKSKVTPNFKGGIAFDIHPCRWFQMGVSLSHDRMSYNIDQLRYFSSDYLNGRIYYSGTDKLLSTTGGKYHDYAKGLMQPAYMTIDIPIRFRINTRHGLHEFVLQNTFKKFYRTWFTQYAGGTDANGFTADGHYYLNDGERGFEVGYLPSGLCGTGLLGSPYYFSQLTRYTFTGKKVTFSLSWQSLQGASPVALGHGPATNDFNVLSETTANPNTMNVERNSKAKYPAMGRLDQDKGFILRSYVAYNICKYVQIGALFKWTDGQPISFYNVTTNSDAVGNTQAAITPVCTRGTNPTDGDFGCRESAIFNFDVHARAQWRLWKKDMSLSLMWYNVWDYGNVLMEYAFPEQQEDGSVTRGHNMSLTIPRGLLVTYKIEL